MDVKIVLVVLPLVALLALFIGYMGHKLTIARTLGDAETRAKRILDDGRRAVEQARADAETKLREGEARIRTAELEAKETALKVRSELEQETRARQKEIQAVERRVVQQEEQLARRLDQLDRREQDLQTRDRVLGERDKAMVAAEARLASALDEQRRKLEGIAGLTADEARRQLMAQVEVESRREAQLLGMRLEEEAKETAQVKAREVLASTIQRLAPDYTVETAVSIVDLPSDDMKGRIIGREGRNIRALELHTGVDLIVDDTPEAVLISSYDPYRREIARHALQVLVADGRTHPARIEEIIAKVKKNIKPETIEAVLVEAADGVSAARHEARRDVLESYIKRLAKLEEIALSYRGVEMCYAIQAGRELRVMTKADIVSDLDAHQLAKDITKRIEAEMQYPGHIKVVVIRETRAVEVAK